MYATVYFNDGEVWNDELEVVIYNTEICKQYDASYMDLHASKKKLFEQLANIDITPDIVLLIKEIANVKSIELVHSEMIVTLTTADKQIIINNASGEFFKLLVSMCKEEVNV